jgi:hypothetical protein
VNILVEFLIFGRIWVCSLSKMYVCSFSADTALPDRNLKIMFNALVCIIDLYFKIKFCFHVSSSNLTRLDMLYCNRPNFSGSCGMY